MGERYERKGDVLRSPMWLDFCRFAQVHNRRLVVGRTQERYSEPVVKNRETRLAIAGGLCQLHDSIGRNDGSIEEGATARSLSHGPGVGARFVSIEDLLANL